MIVFEEVCKEADLFDNNARRLIQEIGVKQKNHQQCFDSLLSEFDTIDLTHDCKRWITYCFARVYMFMVRDHAIETVLHITQEECDRVASYFYLFKETECDEASKFVDLVVDVSKTKGKGFIETLYEIWLTGIVSGLLESEEL